jgi:hypothetical protein
MAVIVTGDLPVAVIVEVLVGAVDVGVAVNMGVFMGMHPVSVAVLVGVGVGMLVGMPQTDGVLHH